MTGDVLKFLGLLITALAALAAALGDTRDKATGKVNKFGQVAIACSLAGFLTSAGAQLSDIYSERAKEATELQRHEQLSTQLSTTIDKQLELGNLLKQSSLATQKLQTIKVVALLQPGIKEIELKPLDLKLMGLLFRANQSEMRVFGAFPPPMKDGRPVNPGYLQLEGPVQRVKIPLGSGFFPGKLSWTDGPSFWIRIYKQDAIEDLKQSRDGGFSYWPYEVIGDFRDAYPEIECEGVLCDKVESVQILVNDTYSAPMPRNEFGRISEHDLFSLLVPAPRAK
jgi:hypothetical protein